MGAPRRSGPPAKFVSRARISSPERNEAIVPRGIRTYTGVQMPAFLAVEIVDGNELRARHVHCQTVGRTTSFQSYFLFSQYFRQNFLSTFSTIGNVWPIPHLFQSFLKSWLNIRLLTLIDSEKT